MTKIHLRLDCYGITGHPQLYMRDLGITYQRATPQSIADQWWFWNCENVPDPLPPNLAILGIKPHKAIGHGLTKEMADEIEPPEVPDNGILAKVPGDRISAGGWTLPPAREGEEKTRTAVVEVAGLGVVRITYELNTYRRGKSRAWHWVAIHAELADAVPGTTEERQEVKMPSAGMGGVKS